METRQSIIEKVTRYVERTYGDNSESSFRKAFDTCDTDQDGQCSLYEIHRFLGLVGVGYLIRNFVAKEVLRLVDTNDDRLITWTEFLTAFRP